MRIGILNTDDVRTELKNEHGQYPEMFKNLLQNPGGQKAHLEFNVYDTHKRTLPSSIDENDAYLITGSRLSTYDNFAWIKNLEEFIRTIHLYKKKLVGICFGHQLVAQALGGKVERSKNGWQLGIKKASEIKNHSEFKLKEFNLIYSHQDEVTKPPESAKIMACTKYCQNVAMSIDKHILTFQGHPEFSVDYALALLKIRADIYSNKQINEAKFSLNKNTADKNLIAKKILKFFHDSN